MLAEFIRLRKIPNRTLRLVVASSAQNSTPRMFVGEFVRPLPHVADKVHHSKRTSSFRMRVDGIRTAHRPVLIRFRNGGRVPLVAPGIDAAIGALRRILPLPFVRQTLLYPGGVSSRILECNPSNGPIIPARRKS